MTSNIYYRFAFLLFSTRHSLLAGVRAMIMKWAEDLHRSMGWLGFQVDTQAHLRSFIVDVFFLPRRAFFYLFLCRPWPSI